jgi:hypothetical protein
MSEASPQTTTGDPRINDTGQPSVGRGRPNNHNEKEHPGRHDNEVPSVLRNYRYDISNNNPAETFDRITQEIAEYVATNLPGAGYMRRFLIDLQEPTLPSPPKPTAPTDSVDEVEYEAELEIWREEVKIVAKRRMEQRCNIIPSVYAVFWRQCTSSMKQPLKSIDTFQEIDEKNDAIALLKLIVDCGRP